MMRRLSRGFWIALLTVAIPVVVLMVVGVMNIAHGGWVQSWRGAFILLAAIGWSAVSVVTAIAFSIWVRGKITLGLWVGLLIAAAIYGLSLLVVGW